MKLRKAEHVRGEITVPGDKSISHRSVMFGSIAKGTTEIHNFLEGADCLSTIGCFRRMGIDIENKNGVVTVHGKGMHGLTAPQRSWTVETPEPPRDLSPVFSRRRIST